MIARRTRLHVEELGQRVLPSASPLNQGIIGQWTGSIATQSLFAASQYASVQAGINPAGPVSRTLPFLASAQIILESPVTAQQLVIHNATQLMAATGMTTAQLAARLNVAHIDWNKQMVVLVSEFVGEGEFSAASPRVDVTALAVGHGSLTVRWHFVQPNPHQIFPMYIALGNPAEVVLTTKFTGPVTFQHDPTVTLPPPYPVPPYTL
jgi:hypothetical protein